MRVKRRHEENPVTRKRRHEENPVTRKRRHKENPVTRHRGSGSFTTSGCRCPLRPAVPEQGAAAPPRLSPTRTRSACGLLPAAVIWPSPEHRPGRTADHCVELVRPQPGRVEIVEGLGLRPSMDEPEHAAIGDGARGGRSVVWVRRGGAAGLAALLRGVWKGRDDRMANEEAGACERLEGVVPSGRGARECGRCGAGAGRSGLRSRRPRTCDRYMRSCTGQPISLPRRSNDSSKYSITMASSKPAATAASQRKASAAASPSPASMAAKPSVSGEGSGDGPVLLAPVPAAPLCPGITTGHPRVFGTDSCTYRKSGSNPAHFAPQPTGPSLSGRPLPTGIFSAAASRERSLACASASAAAAASSGGGAVAAMRSRSASWARVAAASEGGREKRQRVKAASNPERGTCQASGGDGRRQPGE